MKKLITLCALGFVASNTFAADFSGTYKCDLYDKTDGYFKAQLALKLNLDASKLDKGYGSYDITFNVAGLPYSYSGIAAARGNDLAIYFESVGSKRNPDDRGVGIASVVMDQNKDGKDIVSIHKFYYERSYKGKSNFGFENCVKSS